MPHSVVSPQILNPILGHVTKCTCAMCCVLVGVGIYWFSKRLLWVCFFFFFVDLNFKCKCVIMQGGNYKE